MIYAAICFLAFRENINSNTFEDEAGESNGSIANDYDYVCFLGVEVLIFMSQFDESMKFRRERNTDDEWRKRVQMLK